MILVIRARENFEDLLNNQIPLHSKLAIAS
jgi:hypothetical protein